ncbi:UNVERIFIED_CONTAM: hypothetical protein Slati_1728300 [Sesamum latifolium]|uniref:MULE transposase domain-containing protein n=1 Tax=Sesamum latifolium TaxID=2727402 RepID=A0AAW2WWI7_9LAMI
MNCEGQGLGKDGIGFVCEGVCDGGDCEGQGEQGQGGNGECQENEMEGDVEMQNLNTENINNENFETENAQSEHLQPENTENFETENAQSEHLQSENVRVDKGKRKISYAENQSSSEFDDFSDKDYLQPNEASTDSETPSLVLEDLEVSSDKDIFLNKNPSKRDLMHKLRREVLRDWCIRGDFDIEYVKNEKGAHTCARTYDNKLARASYLAKRMESTIRDHPNIPVQQLKNTILRKYKVDVSKQKVQRAKREALKKIRGADSVQYEKLWDYCETVRKYNPGSKLILKKLEDSNPPIFDIMYVCLWALKNGFLSGCRPIIGLDGYFLKTCYGGQMLVAVGRDENDNMFPIAMAVVQVENRENWTWFLGELLDDMVFHF